MTITTLTNMTGTTTLTDASLIRLMSWLSPVFPTGGFAYSAGLESAVAARWVENVDDLKAWLECQLQHGSIRNEALLLAEAHGKADEFDAVIAVSELAEALAESAERLAETTGQGKSFGEAARHWPGVELPPATLALPVAIGCAAGQAGLPLRLTLQAWFNGFAINQLQAAIRLSVTGQNGSAVILAQLEPLIAGQAESISGSCLNDLGSATIHAAIASMQHETIQPRLFLS